MKTGWTLFLDFDGVLNGESFLRYQRNHVPPTHQRLFDPANVEALNRLCDAVPIERIVITSSWRRDRSLEELQAMLAREGFQHPTRVCDVTPSLDGGNESRGAEINKWLAAHGAEQILVLDDFDLSGSIRRGFVRVDAARGLTTELVSSIVEGL